MAVRGKVASRGLEWCFIPSKNLGAATLKPQTNYIPQKVVFIFHPEAQVNKAGRLRISLDLSRLGSACTIDTLEQEHLVNKLANRAWSRILELIKMFFHGVHHRRGSTHQNLNVMISRRHMSLNLVL